MNEEFTTNELSDASSNPSLSMLYLPYEKTHKSKVVFERSHDKIYNMKTLTKRSGFTMIELLVSLAIIAILFTAVVALVGGVKEKSRDSRRMSDVREISKALVLYADNNSNFPIQTTAVTITGSDVVSTTLEAEDTINEVPIDPSHPTYSY